MLSEVVKGVDIVFMCVGNDDDLCLVVYGENGVLVSMYEGSYLVDYIIIFVEVVCEVGV